MIRVMIIFIIIKKIYYFLKKQQFDLKFYFTASDVVRFR